MLELTQKAKEQIVELESYKVDLEKQIAECAKQMTGSTAIVWRALQKERGKLYDKICRADERIDRIRSTGMSTKEMQKICKMATDPCTKFQTVSTDRSLGCSGATKVGFFPPLGKFFEVGYTRYNSFMRNVKGCSKLADTTSVNHVKELSAEEVRERLRTVKHFGFTPDSNKVSERTDAEIDSCFAKIVS